ncbi:MAG: HPF/RaiA family ribosome-associated protein [Ginsengibacter sp.]
MKINLKTLKFKPKDELNNFVTEKVSKLERFDDKIMSADVTLSLDGPNNPENKICEIRLVVPGYDDFVKKNAATFEEAIDNCVEALQTILRRKKIKS